MVVIKNVEVDEVEELLNNYVEKGLEIIEISEGSLTNNYYIYMHDFKGTELENRLIQELIYLGYKTGETNIEKIIEEYEYIYILETCKSCYSSEYTVYIAKQSDDKLNEVFI